MEIQDLNDIANDIAVSRLEVSALEKEKEELLAAIPRLAEIETELEVRKTMKEQLTTKLLESMREAKLKSWKTEQANYARAIRRTALFDPIVKKHIEDKLKKGEAVENWTLQEKEYISIRLTN